ncbi:hypothetical protein DOTSEDRAFT_79350 [Dothistroma septosporum NZE10]|uniref:Heterokaryon incompatibility domain-containing protein n=1 Tax=Dothistroma septosporum (strain NZE10 / CBS 128990) TaxID=675120 RepID=N1PPK9_DOTSN|nr:hypothetical protein DOTSEDRAFT_79350 [Dothistroma septosporum NZE10]
MRLINVHTLETRDFGARVPSYAILSYDWAQHHDNISSTDHLIADIYTDRGYILLQAFCDFIKASNQALAAELDWRRTDWCYINKSQVDDKTSLELPDGVARLYETCTCYVVYLRDAAYPDPMTVTDQADDKNVLRHGAVLQELTIPPSVVLCNIEWYVLPVTDPDDDCALMADITGVPAWRLQRRRSIQVVGNNGTASG